MISFGGAPKFVYENTNSGIINSTIKDFLKGYGVSTSKINPLSEIYENSDEQFFGRTWRMIKLFLDDAGESNRKWDRYL